jgi:hypothetical protein
MSALRVCDPLWPVFGCKVSLDGTHTEVVPTYELPYQFQNEEEDEDADQSDDDSDDTEDSETPEFSGATAPMLISSVGLGLLIGYLITG